MRRKLVALLSVYSMIGGQLFGAANVVYYATPISETALAYSKTYTFDLNGLGVNALSVETAFSTAAPAAVTWTDGVVSTASVSVSSFTILAPARATGSITVVSTTTLAGAFASDTISVASNTALGGIQAVNTISVAATGPMTGGILSLNGSSFTAGTNWTATSFTTQTALNLATAINAASIGVLASTSGFGTGSTVTLTALNVGTYANAYTLTTSTIALQLGGATFTGGTSPAIFGLNGSSFTANQSFLVAATSTGTAINIVSALKTLSSMYGLSVSTTGTGSTVTLTSLVYGTAPNAYTLKASTVALAMGSANFTGGLDKAVFGVMGKTYANGGAWATGNTSSDTAKSISNLLAADLSISSVLTSTWTASGVVNLTAVSTGSVYTYALYTSTQAALTVSYFVGSGAAGIGAVAGGRDAAIFRIKGVELWANRDFQAVTNASTTARNLSDAIQAVSALNSVISTTWTAAGVVTATSTVAGSYYNFQLYTSSQAALTLNVPVTQVGSTAIGFMQGGTDSGITTASSQVTATNVLTLALPVLYTKTAGTSPGALVAGTTYFAISVDSTHFKLAATSTGAIAGVTVSIATQTAAGGGSFTVTPLAFTGSSSFKWQLSNDGTNYADMSVSSGTVFSTSASSFTYTDLGEVRARYLRLNFIKSTTGGTALTATVNGKN